MNYLQATDRLNLNAVLEGCPVGAAVVAGGRLRFANAIFMDRARIETGAGGLRIVFDNAMSASGHADPGGKNATLFWNAADGNEQRMRLVALAASYGGEEAFFLWLTDGIGGVMPDSARHFSLSGDPPEHAEYGAPSAKPGARILLAEDNEINQQIALELLEHVGMEIEVASNGKEAVELFLKKDFDLVLMDIQMPLMDGSAATRAIRTSGKAGADTVPILAMTAHSMDDYREKSLSAGMNGHLTKPIDPQLLYAALDTWLPRGKRAVSGETASAPVSTVSSGAASAEAHGRMPCFTRETVSKKALRQDTPFNLKGFDSQAGLSNLGGNWELYLRLLDRFASHYRNTDMEIRDALRRMEHDASAHEEAERMAHTVKGVAANLGARALAGVAAELEIAIRKQEVRDEMLDRYSLLLHEALDSIENLPKPEDVGMGNEIVSEDNKRRIAAVLDVLPELMQTDWYKAQRKLMALKPVTEGTVAFTYFKEIIAALEEFDSDGVAEKGKLLLAAI